MKKIESTSLLEASYSCTYWKYRCILSLYFEESIQLRYLFRYNGVYRLLTLPVGFRFYLLFARKLVSSGHIQVKGGMLTISLFKAKPRQLFSCLLNTVAHAGSTCLFCCALLLRSLLSFVLGFGQ